MTQPCPPITPGQVTDQAGAVNGWTAAYTDAYGDRQGVVETPGVNSQYQYPVVLSDRAGVGGRYQANEVVKGEHWLVLALRAGRLDSAPLPFPTPGTQQVGPNWTEAGSTYSWLVTYVAKSSKNCNAAEETATGGTITLTAMDETSVAGSYALDFGADHITGTFVAPRAAVAGSMDYTGCPTRPSQQTCIAG